MNPSPALHADPQATLLQQMAAARLFAGMADDVLRTVLDAALLIDVPAGAELAHEGVAEHDFFVLLDGELGVSLALPDGAPPLEVGTLRPGSSFGEMGALLGEARSASVTAARASKLLRLDAAALQTLFERCPGFGWAFSRELAQGLKAALAVKNELQVAANPDTVVLDVPAIEDMKSYMAAYYASALRNVLRQHRLIIDREFPHYEAPLRISADEPPRWHALFGVARGTTPPPFTVHSTVGTLMLMKVVADVGVNFRNLLHLRSEMALAPRDIEPATDYRLRARLADILILRGDRIVLVVDSKLSDAQGQMVRGFRDFFVIINLESQHVDALRASKGFGRLDASELRDASRRRSKLAGRDAVRRTPVAIPEDMGMRYGKVSGDLNLVHTTALAARLFGHPRPFQQGLCTANQVLAILTAEHLARLQQFRISFTQPAFTGQTIEVLTTDSEFEVLDAEAKVLAFGSFARDAAAAAASPNLR